MNGPANLGYRLNDIEYEGAISQVLSPEGRSVSDSEASELPQRRCTSNAPVNTCRSCGRSSSILGVLGDHPGPNRVATQRSPNLEAASLLVTWLRTSLHLSNSTPRTMQTDEVNSLYRRACIDRTIQQSRTKKDLAGSRAHPT